MNKTVGIKNNIVKPVTFGRHLPFVLIAGPCAMEGRAHALEMATALREMTDRLGIPFVYKSSFLKANRTSASSGIGIGLDAAMPIFQEIRESLHVPVITDVHETWMCQQVGRVVDILQVPAFLCRQTHLLIAAGQYGAVVNIKKGQFIHPQHMSHAVEKVGASRNTNVLLTERGACFGHGDLVVDMRSLAELANFAPVIFDATHSTQQPVGYLNTTHGCRGMMPVLARAAVAAGVAGVFIETHECPNRAPSDGAVMWPLDKLERLLSDLKEIDILVKARRLYETL